MFKITEYVNTSFIWTAANEGKSIDDEIVEFLSENPGCRMRTIASFIYKNPVKEVMPALTRLKNKGKIKSVMHRDMANMEFYDLWYVNC